ncbi:hypothetical protein BCR36DRAFT_375854 [Piromyces finnis]|uniref:Uncharacterized protein n=1 Tax=Piromyces finnis TaxID=1754191 RepID=A0A1Y1UCF8_9FUNG|nr:hypothetical protein BCR36DRAFT_375854 [Piromyces finnis]|eukprot:ORX35186.1 hypothetical protein BCR36DRAFT_375854 [Piromyces finnis]
MTNINAITTGQLQGMNNFMNSNNATNGNIQLTTTPIISDNEKSIDGSTDISSINLNSNKIDSKQNNSISELSKDATESSENVNQNITNLDGSSSNIKGKDSIKSDMKAEKNLKKMNQIEYKRNQV